MNRNNKQRVKDQHEVKTNRSYLPIGTGPNALSFNQKNKEEFGSGRSLRRNPEADSNSKPQEQLRLPSISKSKPESFGHYLKISNVGTRDSKLKITVEDQRRLSQFRRNLNVNIN